MGATADSHGGAGAGGPDPPAGGSQGAAVGGGDVLPDATAVWRQRVSQALLAREDEVVRAVEVATAGCGPLMAGDEERRVLFDQESNCRQGVKLVGRWIATGTKSTERELADLARVGRRVARITGTFSRVVLANLAWRDAMRRVLEQEVPAHGGSAELLAELCAGVEQSCDSNLVKTAAQYDEQCQVMEEDLADKERQLRYRALHDPLTGIPNRVLLFDRFRQAVAGSGDEPGVRRPAVVFIDLDDFKAVNDGQGHAAGDAVLRILARRLAAAVRPGDTVARLGGDEFVVFCADIPDQAWVRSLAHRLLGVLGAPVQAGTSTVRVSASIGIAVGSGTCDPDHLLGEADRAMYRAKQAGRSRIEVSADLGAGGPGAAGRAADLGAGGPGAAGRAADPRQGKPQ